MRQSRPYRLFTALLALVCVVFMQMATAAYACPTLADAQVRVLAPAAEHAGMAGCEGVVDLEQPNLCQSHAQFGNQSLDKPAQPPVAPFAAAALVLQLDAATHLRFDPPPLPALMLSRVTAPPLAITHCCFRI